MVVAIEQYLSDVYEYALAMKLQDDIYNSSSESSSSSSRGGAISAVM